MVSSAEIAADSLDVHPLYNPGPARAIRGAPGTDWLDRGSGFTEPGALASLARAVLDDPAMMLPQAVSRDVGSVAAWLAIASSEATLDE